MGGGGSENSVFIDPEEDLNWTMVVLNVYAAASKRILKKLDPIHHQGFRIARGAFPTFLVVVAFSSLMRIFGEYSTICSPPALFFFFLSGD